MKLICNLLLTSFFLLLVEQVYAQNYLGLYPGYSTNGSYAFQKGPKTTVGPIWFSTDNDQSSPTGGEISVTATFGDQQYTNLTTLYSSDPSYDGMSFGLKDNNNDKKLNKDNVFVDFSNVATPEAGYYDPTEGMSGIDPSEHYAFNQYLSTEGIAQEVTNAEYYFGTVTYTFSKPVDDPVMQFTGLGGFLAIPDLGTQLPYSVDYRLSGSSVTIEYLDGTKRPDNSRIFDVINGNEVRSNYEFSDFPTSGGASGASGDYAGTGSVVLRGTDITEVTFDLYLRGKIEDQQWSSYVGDTSDNEVFAGDRHNISFTLPVYDFGGIVVVDDNKDGSTKEDISSTTNPVPSSQLRAVLVDEQGNVAQVQQVATDGTFNFSAVLGDNYKVVITTTQPEVGDPAPSPSLPDDWYNQEESFDPTNANSSDGTTDGQTNASLVNFATSSEIGPQDLIIGITQLQPQSLPIELSYFRAEAEGVDGLLTWGTSSEENNSNFEVERSVDGRSWDYVGRVEGKGTTGREQSYSFTDAGIGRKQSTVYYRLVQVDYDGSKSESEVRVVNFENRGGEVSIYPNPVVEELNVNYTGGATYRVLIYDMMGKLVNDSTGGSKIDMSVYKAGTYTVRVMDGSGSVIKTESVVVIR